MNRSFLMVQPQPITLTVGVETKLWLWVERGLTNTEHTVHARLVRADDTAPISGQPIKLDVNGTVYTLKTNSTGYANQSLNLVAVGGQTTTYQIRAVFEGAGFKTRNLTITDPYGRYYPVCTTMQWGFKSSQNMVTLTVEAPKTDATVSAPASPSDKVTVTQKPKTTTVTVPPPKTPEQMQAEAEQSGQLKVWHEFTWWYPWYRIHYVSLHSRSMEFDLGMSVLFFADTVQYAESLLQRVSQFLPRVIWTIVATIAAAEFTALVASSYAGPLGFFAALGISLATKLGALYTNLNSVDGLISAYIGSLFATVLGLVRMMSLQLVADLIKLLSGIISLAEFGFGKLYSIISVPINIVYQRYILQRLHELGALP